MIFLVFMLLPFAEIYVFIQVGERFGYFNAVMAIVASFFLGLMVVQSQGRGFIIRAQADLMRKELPARAVVHSLLVFLGGILLMIPGFITDVLGLLLIVPGPRHASAGYLRKFLARQIEKGRLQFFGNGRGFSAGGFGMGRRPNPFAGIDPESLRDVTPKIIDVTPLRSESDKIFDSPKPPKK